VIIKDMIVQYICNGCGKTGSYSVYGLHEKIEKVYEKNIRHHVGDTCTTCHKAKTVVRHAEMKLATPISSTDIRYRYELDWYCKDCGRSWSQYRYLTKRYIEGGNVATVIKNSTNCTCDNSNRDFFLKGFTRKL